MVCIFQKIAELRIAIFVPKFHIASLNIKSKPKMNITFVVRKAGIRKQKYNLKLMILNFFVLLCCEKNICIGQIEKK
ncbi:hypothetical protein BpHYR1_020278 [Brachionus plicatilis]|uniref:Uncharacterized protein n=1 Tax=Brachionus plicatilis TaxID=10195 RepID=A0A3M7RY84_BRAPC|nr:hypothetical protein BpHYR1_020278 [Brachionus plicatilis]